MKITYPIPAETTSVFVVAVDRTPTDLSSIVPWRMGKPHRRAAMDVLDTPRLELEAYRSGQSPWRRMDVSPGDLKRVRAARYHVVISSTAPVAVQPEAAQVARAAARGVAEAYRGTILDPLTGTAVYHCARCPGERQDFRLGDDWLGWTAAETGQAESCASQGAAGMCACLRMTSRGLRRFGLPEIMLEGAACAHSLCAATILRTVAGRLLGEHLEWTAANPAASFRTVGERLRVDGADFAVLSGTPDAEGEPFRVRLTRGAAGRACARVAGADGADAPLRHTPGLLVA
ncbi:hypothetical protein [Microbispora sp. NPDC049125]|uniref:hypothetical protein n=1 Tax=Microbispora sp. NPDC049125 TaxID=3154929 RepID=UPI003466A665